MEKQKILFFRFDALWKIRLFPHLSMGILTFAQYWQCYSLFLWVLFSILFRNSALFRHEHELLMYDAVIPWACFGIQFLRYAIPSRKFDCSPVYKKRYFASLRIMETWSLSENSALFHSSWCVRISDKTAVFFLLREFSILQEVCVFLLVLFGDSSHMRKFPTKSDGDSRY